MTKIASEKLLINRADNVLFEFLSDFTRFGELMPEQITNWKATPDSCSFTIQGMANISMRIAEKVPFSLLKMNSEKDTPFEFTMNCLFNQESENSTFVCIEFIADLPPMIKMMASKPLKNFVDLLVARLKQLAESPDFNQKL